MRGRNTTRYRITPVGDDSTLASFTMYGDHDSDSFEILHRLIQESIAVASACGYGQSVVVHRDVVAL